MKVAVIGGGASGLMAAYACALNGNDVTVYEKNEKCGKKIYITGKGRCNLTNAVPPQEFLSNVVNGSKFLTSAIYTFSPDDTINLFENLGLRLKTERGNRVFPVSDHASDVTHCLENACRNLGVNVIFNANIDKICILNSTLSDIIINNVLKKYDKVIVCTGGVTYPATGSTGDGYKFALDAGHTVVPPKPALCGLNLKGKYFADLQGLTLKNVSLSIYYREKKIKELFGEMLFTHFGVSGPIILTASSYINRLNMAEVELSLDLKPALDESKLDERILRDFGEAQNKTVSNVLKQLLPTSLIPVVLDRCGIDCDKKVNSITKNERLILVKILKNFDLTVESLRPFEEAVVTSGGVNVNEINPKTMESKLVKGLYFCGEVLDVDALTGGFNLQIAFSTGYVAGSSIK